MDDEYSEGMTIFFHGTDADLNIGDVLVPGSVLNVSANYGRSEHVYMTWDNFIPDEDEELTAHVVALKEAYAWARTACMVAEDERGEEDVQAFVYIVEPLGEVFPDDSCDDGVGDEAVRTSSAVIVGVVDVYDLFDFRPAYGDDYLNF